MAKLRSVHHANSEKLTECERLSAETSDSPMRPSVYEKGPVSRWRLNELPGETLRLLKGAYPSESAFEAHVRQWTQWHFANGRRESPAKSKPLSLHGLLKCHVGGLPRSHSDDGHRVPSLPTQPPKATWLRKKNQENHSPPPPPTPTQNFSRTGRRRCYEHQITMRRTSSSSQRSSFSSSHPKPLQRARRLGTVPKPR